MREGERPGTPVDHDGRRRPRRAASTERVAQPTQSASRAPHPSDPTIDVTGLPQPLAGALLAAALALAGPSGDDGALDDRLGELAQRSRGALGAARVALAVRDEETGFCVQRAAAGVGEPSPDAVVEPVRAGRDQLGTVSVELAPGAALAPEQRAALAVIARIAAQILSPARRGAERTRTLERLSRENAILRRAAAVERQFSALLLADASLREITEKVTELCRRPCAMHDERGRRLGLATPGESAVVPRLLHAEMRAEPEVAQALSGLEPGHPTLMGPWPAAGVHQRVLVARLVAGGCERGHLVIGEHDRLLSSFDSIVLRRAASSAVLVLLGERRLLDAVLGARETLARSLIMGGADEADLRRHADRHGLWLDAPHVVAHLVARDPLGTPPPTAKVVLEALERIERGLGALLAPMQEGTAIILDAPADLPPRAAVARVKELAERVAGELSPRGEYVIGLSSVCRSPSDYPAAWVKARQVARCIVTFWGGEPRLALSADDLGPGLMLLAGLSRADAERYVEHALGSLLDEDERSRADLLATLRVYFETARNARRSARRLGVHENTIRYRIAKAEELTGLQITSNADDELVMQLTLLILRLQRRLPEAAPPLAAVAGDSGA
jgi:sugar diacid utilization regulator